MDEWMVESLASSGVVPQEQLSEASVRGLDELRSARAHRLEALQEKLDALVSGLPADLGTPRACPCVPDRTW